MLRKWFIPLETKIPFFEKLKYRVKNIWHPEIFQGVGKKNEYFEGWYYKVVNKTETAAYAVIAGLSLAGEKSHAFIQILDGAAGASRYFVYKTEEFSYSPDKFEVRVKDNYFSAEKLILKIEDGDNSYEANLDFEGLKPWPVTLFSPGIMGPYSFVPFMECYHGVVGLNHRIKGSFTASGKKIDFSGGKGYIEKDRGSSMPESWIWMQNNHFEEEDASLTLSIAKIPWLGHPFPGFIAGFWLKGTLYKFTTYNGTKIKNLQAKEDTVEIEMESAAFLLKVEARRKNKSRTLGMLSSPSKGEMKGRISESLDAEIEVELLSKKTGLSFKGKGRNGGLEIVGDVSRL